MAVAGGRVRLHRANLASSDSDDFRGFRGRSLTHRLSLAPPDDERTSDLHDRCGVLNHNLKRSQSPCRDHVHRCVPLLDSGVDDLDIAEIACPHGALYELALAYRALDQRHLRLRERDRQRQPGRSGTGAKIRDRRRGPNLPEFERDERIRQVVVHRVGSVDRRRRQRILCQQGEQRREPLRRRRRQAVALSQCGDLSLSAQAAPVRER